MKLFSNMQKKCNNKLYPKCESLKAGKAHGHLCHHLCLAILLSTALVVHTHQKKEWTQSTQQTQHRTLGQALSISSKGTTLSSNLNDFFLTWRMLSKILESKNEELPMIQVYSHHCSPPRDRTLSKRR